MVINEAPDVAALQFLNLLSDPQWRAQAAVQKTLDSLRVQTASLRDLRNQLGSRDPDVREATARQLLALRDRVISHLTGMLRVRDGGLRIMRWLLAWRAAWMMARVPQHRHVQPPTKEVPDAAQWEQCWSAAEALAVMGAAAVPGLIGVLRSGNVHSQRAAAHTLGRIGAAAQPAVPHLIALLSHPRHALANTAADALIGIGSPALQGVLPVMAHPATEVRRTATHIIGQIAADHPSARLRYVAVTRLLLGLRDEESEVCRVSAEGLGRIARVHPELVLRIAPSLLPLLKDRRESVRTVTARALESMGDEVVPILAGALESTSEALRIEASRILRRIGTPDALSVLEEG